MLQDGSLGSVCRVSPGPADLLSKPIEKPSDTKDLQCALFSLAKTLPKHAAHYTLPHAHNATPTGLIEQLGTALTFSGSLRFERDWAPDWSVILIRALIGWRSALVGQRLGLLPGPKAHLLRL